MICIPRCMTAMSIHYKLGHRSTNVIVYEECLMVSEQARGDGRSTVGGMMRGNDAHDEC